jgi:hypothetical protein
LELYVKESFRVFTQPEVKLEHIYKQYKKDPKIENEKINRRKYECDTKKKKEKDAKDKSMFSHKQLTKQIILT